MSGSTTERNPDATVYVGGIDQKVTNDIVWELFSQCGIVINVHLPKDKITGEHQGYGFVEFKSEEDADYAIKIMHMVKLFQKPLKVNKASQDRRTQEVGANIFIGSLDPSITEMQLSDTFSAFGLILSRRIVRDPDSNESKGYAFISFDNFESGDNAIAAMNGQFYGSQKITCQYAFKKDSKGERHGSAAERLLAANRPQQMMQSGLSMSAPAPLVPKGLTRQSAGMAEGMMQPSGNSSGQQSMYGGAGAYGGYQQQQVQQQMMGGQMQGYSMPAPPSMPPPMYGMPPQGMPPQNMQYMMPPPPPMSMPPLPPGGGAAGGFGQYPPPPPNFMPPNMPNMPMPPMMMN